MTSIFAYKPYLRPSIVDIIGHSWLQNGDIWSHDQVFAEMQRRHAVNKSMKRRENSQSGAGDVVRRDDYDKNEIRSMKDITVEDLPDYGFFTPEMQATIFHDLKQLGNARGEEEDCERTMTESEDKWKLEIEVVKKPQQLQANDDFAVETEDGEEVKTEDLEIVEILERVKLQMIIRNNPVNDSLKFVELRLKVVPAICSNKNF